MSKDVSKNGVTHVSVEALREDCIDSPHLTAEWRQRLAALSDQVLMDQLWATEIELDDMWIEYMDAVRALALSRLVYRLSTGDIS